MSGKFCIAFPVDVSDEASLRFKYVAVELRDAAKHYVDHGERHLVFGELRVSSGAWNVYDIWYRLHRERELGKNFCFGFRLFQDGKIDPQIGPEEIFLLGDSDGLACAIAAMNPSDDDEKEVDERPILLASCRIDCTSKTSSRMGLRNAPLGKVTKKSDTKVPQTSLKSKWESAKEASKKRGCVFLIHRDDFEILKSCVKNEPQGSCTTAIKWFESVDSFCSEVSDVTQGELYIVSLGRDDMPSVLALHDPEARLKEIEVLDRIRKRKRARATLLFSSLALLALFCFWFFYKTDEEVCTEIANEGFGKVYNFNPASDGAPDPHDPGRIELMARYAKKALNGGRDCSQAHMLLGRYHHLKGDHEKAIDEFNLAHSLNPDNCNYYMAMGTNHACPVKLQYAEIADV